MNMVLTQTTIPTTAGFPWLSLLVGIPMGFALAIWLIPWLRSIGREVSLAVSSAVLAGVLVALFTSYDFAPETPGAFQLGESYSWMPAIGLSWALGVNGLGMVMIILATALTPGHSGFLAGRHRPESGSWLRRPHPGFGIFHGAAVRCP